MQIVSINVGMPRNVEYRGQQVSTGIYKSPIEGRVMLHVKNLVGDGQADLKVHGGPDKAVYAYPHEHYAFWQAETGRDDFEYGQFGENFTTTGLLEDDVCIGDRFQVGEAIVEVSQPRMPCFKLGIKMGDSTFVKQFAKARRSGFYFRVIQTGEVGAGDTLTLLQRGENPMMTVKMLTHLYFDDAEPELLQQAAELSTLPQAWRDYFAEQLQR